MHRGLPMQPVVIVESHALEKNRFPATHRHEDVFVVDSGIFVAKHHLIAFHHSWFRLGDATAKRRLVIVLAWAFAAATIFFGVIRRILVIVFSVVFGVIACALVFPLLLGFTFGLPLFGSAGGRTTLFFVGRRFLTTAFASGAFVFAVLSISAFAAAAARTILTFALG